MNIKLFRKGDAAVIAAVLLAALTFLLWQKTGDRTVARIAVNGETVESIELSDVTERITFTPKTEPPVVICAENGAIWFESAECPDKLCVSCGKLTRKGDTAVCLPSGTVITVLGADVDAVTY